MSLSKCCPVNELYAQQQSLVAARKESRVQLLIVEDAALAGGKVREDDYIDTDGYETKEYRDAKGVEQSCLFALLKAMMQLLQQADINASINYMGTSSTLVFEPSCQFKEGRRTSKSCLVFNGTHLCFIRYNEIPEKMRAKVMSAIKEKLPSEVASFLNHTVETFGWD